ncbi:MAG: dolichyl-phosphate beta-glucosyltransferase [Promethearchaeota archaeon]
MNEKLELSIVVPAYNEQLRITSFMKNLLDFSKKHLESYEIIIVDDGSTDNTYQVVKDLIRDHENTRVITYNKNKGKGFAVFQGILNAKGEFVLFIDADGSTPPEEIMNMNKIYKRHGYDVIIGTRIDETSSIENPQPISRKLLSLIFNIYSNLLFHLSVNDLLCGFKGFKKEVAIRLFENLQSFRWEFDVEILYKARKLNYSLYQIPIKWKHEEGSKIKKSDPFFIFLNLFKLRLKFLKKV